MTTATPSRTTRTLAGLAAGVLIAITGAACSGASDDSGSSGDVAASDAGGASASRAEAAPAAPGKAQDAAATSQQVAQQQVVSTGTVKLTSKDVADSADDVRRVARQYAGTLAQDATTTDRAGDADHAHLVLRVPVASFTDALDALEATGTLISSDSSSEDVTTQVLDTDVRVASERASIKRIQALYDDADSIDAVVRLEGELSRRQADLASLEQQQRYLADQTALSTIDVTISRTAPPPAVPRSEDASGFVAGLGGGWHALTAFAVVAATVLGALLPWLVVLALLGVPAWVLVRRTRRRATA
jgi:hypothetical protein